jgi:hypothetical protein
MENENRRRWEVKDTVLSEWRALQGEFTASEIWEMRKKGISSLLCQSAKT